MLEAAFALLAPYNCVGCDYEGALLCEDCATYLKQLPSRCYKCHKQTLNFSVCAGCRRKTILKNVWVGCNYEKLAKDLVVATKFEHKRAGALCMARSMAELLPRSVTYDAVTFVPTATTRRRMRGFDHSQLIAKEIAMRIHAPIISYLNRTGQSRQVGTKRAARLQQLKSAYWVNKHQDIAGKTILLVDDVLTTGATLETAAQALKSAGAKRVDAIAFAQAG